MTPIDRDHRDHFDEDELTLFRDSLTPEIGQQMEFQWERTACLLGGIFREWLRGEVQLTFRSQRFRRFDSFVRELELPTSCLRFEATTTPSIVENNTSTQNHPFLMELGPRLLFPILDRLLGGRQMVMAPRRPLTEMDRRVTFRLGEAIASGLVDAWRESGLRNVQMLGVETDPTHIRVLAEDTTVVVAYFDFQVESIQGTIRFCQPLAAVVPSITSPTESTSLVPDDIRSANEFLQINTCPTQNIPQSTPTVSSTIALDSRSSAHLPTLSPIPSVDSSSSVEPVSLENTASPTTPPAGTTEVECTLSFPPLTIDATEIASLQKGDLLLLPWNIDDISPQNDRLGKNTDEHAPSSKALHEIPLSIQLDGEPLFTAVACTLPLSPPSRSSAPSPSSPSLLSPDNLDDLSHSKTLDDVPSSKNSDLLSVRLVVSSTNKCQLT